VSSIVARDCVELVVGNHVGFQEHERLESGRFDRHHEPIEAGKRSPKLSNRLPEEPPVAPPRGAIVQVPLRLHSHEEVLVHGRITVAKLIQREAETIQNPAGVSALH